MEFSGDVATPATGNQPPPTDQGPGGWGLLRVERWEEALGGIRVDKRTYIHTDIIESEGVGDSNTSTDAETHRRHTVTVEETNTKQMNQIVGQDYLPGMYADSKRGSQ